MTAVGLIALRRRSLPWHREGAVVVLCMTGCAVAAFIPPGFFEAISTARHMVGMNLATTLSIPIAAALAISMLAHPRRRSKIAATVSRRPAPPVAAGRRTARFAISGHRQAGAHAPALCTSPIAAVSACTGESEDEVLQHARGPRRVLGSGCWSAPVV